MVRSTCNWSPYRMHHSLYLYSLGTRYPPSTTCLFMYSLLLFFFPRFHTTTSIDLCIFSLWTIITIHHTRHSHTHLQPMSWLFSLSRSLSQSFSFLSLSLDSPIHNPFPYPLPRHAHTHTTYSTTHIFLNDVLETLDCERYHPDDECIDTQRLTAGHYWHRERERERECDSARECVLCT